MDVKGGDVVCYTVKSVICGDKEIGRTHTQTLTLLPSKRNKVRLVKNDEEIVVSSEELYNYRIYGYSAERCTVWLPSKLALSGRDTLVRIPTPVNGYFDCINCGYPKKLSQFQDRLCFIEFDFEIKELSDDLLLVEGRMCNSASLVAGVVRTYAKGTDITGYRAFTISSSIGGKSVTYGVNDGWSEFWRKASVMLKPMELETWDW